MRTAIIGTGRVGTALGGGWAAAGHQVVFGSRHPADVDCAAGTADTIEGAARAAEVVVLAVPYAAAPDALAAVGDLDGKIVVDATNPMGSGRAPLDRFGGRWVKAFNTMGFETMATPVVDGRAAVCLLAGDDADAKATVAHLATDLGFEAVDAGDAQAIPMLENLAELWVHLAFRAGQSQGIAFALLRRPT